MARVSTKSPGVVVVEALKKLGASPEKLSEAAGIPVAKINAVINKGDLITPELSVRLGRALGEKDGYFAELQLRSDISAAAKAVEKIAKLRKPAGRPGRKPAEKKVNVPAGKPGRKPGGAPGKKPAASPVVAQTPDPALPKKRGRKPGTKAKE
ncbi:MAG: HigA family addiction module antidote protein [Spirochaetaceae bacterium]|jgi:addiction module HigA family antidote|nr:HigA family addiction module antidote protein [Spirochaetaceae bacterium]